VVLLCHPWGLLSFRADQLRSVQLASGDVDRKYVARKEPDARADNQNAIVAKLVDGSREITL
jgi:hypothetical protein